MKPAELKKRLAGTAFIIILLAAIMVTATGCEALGYPPPSNTPTEQAAEPEASKPLAVSQSKDSTILAVYQHLLGQAGSYEAKIYLSDFYATCDNWSATSEYFKDGSGTWLVAVDESTSDNDSWTHPPHWRQAGWFIFKDGAVIPANLYNANALRIEADLQALSPETEEEEED
jgi:hypothetical protein